ncbi:unnamed protein product, partial [Phaeothamnion confervicola]
EHTPKKKIIPGRMKRTYDIASPMWRRQFCSLGSGRQIYTILNPPCQRFRTRTPIVTFSAPIGRHWSTTGTLPDVCGAPVTAKSWEVVKLIDQAIDDYTALTGDPVGRASAAAALDPRCGTAHSLAGMLMILSGTLPPDAP